MYVVSLYQSPFLPQGLKHGLQFLSLSQYIGRFSIWEPVEKTCLCNCVFLKVAVISIFVITNSDLVVNFVLQRVLILSLKPFCLDDCL